MMKTQYFLNGELLTQVASFIITEQNAPAEVSFFRENQFLAENPQGRKVLADLKIAHDNDYINDYNKLYAVYVASTAKNGKKVEVNFTVVKRLNNIEERTDYLLSIPHVEQPTEYQQTMAAVSPENYMFTMFKLNLTRKSEITIPIVIF